VLTPPARAAYKVGQAVPLQCKDWEARTPPAPPAPRALPRFGAP
jgi:hypothetical protein